MDKIYCRYNNTYSILNDMVSEYQGYDNCFESMIDLINKAVRYTEETQEKIVRQITKLEQLNNEISLIVTRLQRQEAEQKKDIEIYQNKIDYLYNHPTVFTSVDEDGNTTTTKIVDTNAVRDYETRIERLQTMRRIVLEKLNKANSIQSYIKDCLEKLRTLLQATKQIESMSKERLQRVTLLFDEAHAHESDNVISIKHVLSFLDNYFKLPGFYKGINDLNHVATSDVYNEICVSEESINRAIANTQNLQKEANNQLMLLKNIYKENIARIDEDFRQKALKVLEQINNQEAELKSYFEINLNSLYAREKYIKEYVLLYRYKAKGVVQN